MDQSFVETIRCREQLRTAAGGLRGWINHNQLSGPVWGVTPGRSLTSWRTYQSSWLQDNAACFITILIIFYCDFVSTGRHTSFLHAPLNGPIPVKLD